MQTPDVITGPINLGNPTEITIRELVECVIDLTGSRSKLEFCPIPPDDPSRRCPDITKARETLDWEPRFASNDGLFPTITWLGDLLKQGQV